MELSDEQTQLKIREKKYATAKGDNGQQTLAACPLESTGNSINISEKDWSEGVLCENDLDEMKNNDLLNSGEHCKPEMQQNRILTIQRADNAIACINETLA